MPAELESTVAGSVEAKVADVGTDLAKAFAAVLSAIPGSPHRPQGLARLLDVNVVLTSRLLKAVQQQDPIAVAHTIPGPEPLRRLLRAAERKRADRSAVRHAQLVVDRFEQLIATEAADRSSLDALISGWLPEARERVELIAKQSVFRGMSQLLGLACETEHCIMLLYPSAERPDRADAVSIDITRGLRRVRPGLAVKYDTVHSSTPMQTVTGQPVNDLHSLLLRQFCSQPVPELEVTQAGDYAQYTLRGEGVGVQSAVDLVHATFFPARKPMHRSSAEAWQAQSLALGVSMPCKTCFFDVFLHDEVYPGRQPRLDIYRTAGVFGPRRELDRLEVIETLQPLGRGLDRVRAAESPACQDVIRYVCDQRRWDVAALRGYRCRIRFPIYSSEIVMTFASNDVATGYGVGGPSAATL